MGPKRAKRPKKKLDQRQFDIYGDIDDEYSQSQTKNSQSQSQSILGRPNTLINLLSQDTASSRPKAPIILDDDTTQFEEDDGFRYKRSQDQNSPLPPKKAPRRKQPNGKAVSTPISRLKQDTASLNVDDDEDIQFEAIEPKRATKSKSKQASRSSNGPKKPNRSSSRIKAKQLATKSSTIRLSSPIRSPPFTNVYDSSSDDYHEQVSHHTIELVDADSKKRSQAQASGPNKRRASYNNRGKRVLSIGNGFVGEPHDNIDPQDYYKFLNSSMPDPNRMRQLLIWCFKKALQNQGKSSETVRGITKVITDEFLEGLTNGKISTSWYNRQEVEPVERPILPNPLNETNEESIILFEEKLMQIRKEKQQWENAYKRAIRPIEGLQIEDSDSIQTLGKYLKRQYTSSKDGVDYNSSVIDKSLIGKIEKCWTHVEQNAPQELESNVDRLYSTSYQMSQAQELVDKLKAERINEKVSSLVRRFLARNDPQNFTNADSKVTWPLPKRQITTQELLRGISRVENNNT